MERDVEEHFARIVESARSAGPLPTWSAESRAAREQLITANLGLVGTIALEFARRYRLPMEELRQEGTVGLIEAVDDFDWRRGRLGTLAAALIRRRIAAFALVRCGEVHATSRQVQRWSAHGYELNLGIPASIDVDPELAWELVDEQAHRAFERVECGMGAILSQLSPHDRYIVGLRYGFGGEVYTYQDLADHLGITKSAARQRVQRILDTLRSLPESLAH